MKRLAAALLAVLTLSACAVTGQPARPGTAAIYDGATITTAQVAAWGSAENALGFVDDPGAILTLLLLKPALDKQAATEGAVFDDKQISTEAQTWMSVSKTKAVSPTQDMMDVVRTVRVLHALLLTQTGKDAIRKAVQSIEANAVASPMYGHFTVVQFAKSVDTLAQRYNNQAGPYGDVNYLVFKDLSGFDLTTKQEWMVDAGLPSPSPNPSAAPVATSPAPSPAP